MANKDDQYEALLRKTRVDARRLEKEFAKMHPRELAKIQERAMAAIHSLPSEARSTVLSVIAQENKSINGLGALGFVQSAAAIANIVAAAGNIGLSVYQMDAAKKDQKKARKIQEQQVAAQNRLIDEQMKSLRLQNQEVEEQAELARKQREAQEKAIAEGRVPAAGGAQPGAPAASSNNKLLLAGGAVAAAAVAALVLSK